MDKMATESREENVIDFGATQLLKNSGTCSVSSLGGGGVLELGRKLLAAAREGHTDLVRDLMAQGAPFTSDWLGTSPLHLAAMNGHAETCGVLLRAGMSRDCRTKVDRTALHEAAAHGHARVVRLLLEAGADPRAADLLRMTPLHWAVERGHHAVATELLRQGADPRAVSKFLLSPLQMSARRGGRLQALLHDAAEGARPPPTPPPAPPTPPAHEAAEPEPIVLESTEAEAEDAGSSGAAAALLRAHGITLLPADPGGTALSALRHGRTLVLSDAGRLLLDESAAPRQLKVVSSPPRAAPPAGSRRPPKTVKILVNKSHLGKLIAAARAPPTPPATPAPPAGAPSQVVRVPEQFLCSTDPSYLRRQLLAAHASIASLRRQLQDRP